MTITGQSALSKDDIDRMMRDAESHADEDRRRKVEAEARNTAENLVWQVDKQLRDVGEQIAPEVRGKVEVSLASLREALAGTDVDAIVSGTDRLMNDAQDLSQKAYEAAQQSGFSGGADDGGGAGVGASDDVVDAEIVDES